MALSEGVVPRAVNCHYFFFPSRRRHTRFDCDWSSDVCSSDLLGFTVTNWMIGIIATVVNHPLKRTAQILVNGFFIAVVLWMVGKVLFPQAQSFLFFLSSTQSSYIFTPYNGGPLSVLTSFAFHSMIMPTFELVDRFSAPPNILPNNWPLMVTQDSGPGSGP